MAKSKKKARPDERPTPTASAGGSLLLSAYARYEQGDVATARKAAQAVLARPPAAEDQAAARQLSRQLQLPGEPDPHALARSLLENIRPPTKAYVLGVLAFAVAVLLTALAVARY